MPRQLFGNSHPRAGMWRFTFGLCLLLGGMLCLVPQPVAAQGACYEPGALRIVMSWTTPSSVGALKVEDPYGKYATSWDGWPEHYGPQGPYIDGVGSPFNTLPGSQIFVMPTDNDPEFGRGGRIEFDLPDPEQGTYRVRAAVPLAEFDTNLTVEIYAGGVMTAPVFSELHTIPASNWNDAAFWAWHWEVGDLVICSDKPILSEVKAQYPIDHRRFLEGIQVLNPIVASVDWAGLTPDRVEFKLNGRLISTVPTSGRDAQHTLDMGFDLDEELNRLEVVAYGRDKANRVRPSEPRFAQFYSIPLPTWLTFLTGQGLMTLPALVGGTAGGFTYDMGFAIPVEPFTIDALRIGPPDGKAKFEWGVDGGLTIPIDCISDLSAAVSASGSNFRFLNADIDLRVSGELQFPRDGACGFQSPVGTVAVQGEYGGTLYRKPSLVMVTYFNVVVGQTVDTIIVVLHLEKFVGQIGEFYIDGSIGLEANATLDFSVPALQDLGLTGEVGLTGGYRSDLKVVEVDLYAGANGTIGVVRPGAIDLLLLNNWQFDKITIQGEVGAKFRTFWFVREAKGNITWSYPAAQTLRLTDAVQSSDWQLVPHPVRPSTPSLQLAPDAALAFATNVQRRASSAFTGVQRTVTSTLASNVYPYPDTSLAVHPVDDQALLLWVDIDDTKPLGQAQELFFSRWDGTAWQPPAAVTDDNLLDGATQVAWAGDGQAVALWHRMKTPLAADASLTTTVTQQLEIATAVYNPTTALWGAATWLTTNDVLDGTPQLARGAGGELVAAWRRNVSGLLSGDMAAPDQIVAAFYQNGWQTPAVAVDAIPGLLEFAVGIGKSDALNATTTLAYTQNVTPTGGITPTAQLFVATWDGSSWSPPQQLTDAAEAQRTPQILYTLQQHPFLSAENEPILFWLAGDQLHVRNLKTALVQTLPLPAAIQGVDEFRALLDANGNIAVVFVNKTLPRNLYLVYYDQGSQLWGSPRQLTDEEHSLKFLSPGFDSSGRLLLAYGRAAVAYEERQRLEGGEPIRYTIPVETQTDLVTLSHTFLHNLKISDADLAFARSETAENQVVISATVHNDSDRAAHNVVVHFYRGDPASGGVWFGTGFVPDPMPGNTQTTVAATYTPWFTPPEDIYVVVSASGVVESTELDNQARLLGIGADLELVQLDVTYGQNGGATLRSTIRNNGYSDVYDGALVYSVEGLTEPLAQQTFSVAAGQTTRATLWVDLTLLPSGVYPMAATVGVTRTNEFTRADNQIGATLAVLPDLALALEPPVGSVLNVTVRNIGAAPSAAVPVRFYSAGGFAEQHLLHSDQVGQLAPGGTQTLTVQWSDQLCQLYAVIDPDNLLDEQSKANNVAANLQLAEACAPQIVSDYKIYLPSIRSE